MAPGLVQNCIIMHYFPLRAPFAFASYLARIWLGMKKGQKKERNRILFHTSVYLYNPSAKAV